MRQQTDRERQRQQSRMLTREAPGPWPRPHCATAVSGQRRALTALPGTAGRTASGHARPGPLAAPLPVASLRPSVSSSLVTRPGTQIKQTRSQGLNPGDGRFQSRVAWPLRACGSRDGSGKSWTAWGPGASGTWEGPAAMLPLGPGQQRPGGGVWARLEGRRSPSGSDGRTHTSRATSEDLCVQASAPGPTSISAG